MVRSPLNQKNSTFTRKAPTVRPKRHTIPALCVRASECSMCDYLVIIDFEATCDEGENPVVTRKNQEIIEFPWYAFCSLSNVLILPRVVLDAHTAQILYKQQVFVKPEWTTTLTPFCTRLTGIKNEHLVSAGPLRDAVQQVSDPHERERERELVVSECESDCVNVRSKFE